MTTEVFQTRFGLMRLAWGDGDTLLLVDMYPSEEDKTRHLNSNPSMLAQKIQAHLNGNSQDFSDLKLERKGLSPFALRVYEEARKIPPGQVVTYGELAKRVGSPGAARAVGTALAHNPFLIVVPCHRIIAGKGSKGGFSAPGGLKTKSLFLAAEGFGTESLWDPGEMERGYQMLLQDKKLSWLLKKVGPCPLQPNYPHYPFAALARGVLYQQLAGSAAKAIEQRVKALGSDPFPSPQELLELTPQALREAGLSGSKIVALKTLAEAVNSGNLKLGELRLVPDDEVIERVCRLKGFGPWSAEMFLLFHLGRRNLLPVKDLGIRKGFMRVFSLVKEPTAQYMERKAKGWQPYRSLACWYLWRSLEV